MKKVQQKYRLRIVDENTGRRILFDSVYDSLTKAKTAASSLMMTAKSFSQNVTYDIVTEGGKK